jgi:hypothetical protein
MIASVPPASLSGNGELKCKVLSVIVNETVEAIESVKTP